RTNLAVLAERTGDAVRDVLRGDRRTVIELEAVAQVVGPRLALVGGLAGVRGQVSDQLQAAAVGVLDVVGQVPVQQRIDGQRVRGVHLCRVEVLGRPVLKPVDGAAGLRVRDRRRGGGRAALGVDQNGLVCRRRAVVDVAVAGVLRTPG